MTYGQLIGEARQLMRRSAAAPIILPNPDEALAVCYARGRLYRVLATACTLRPTPHPGQPATRGGNNFVVREEILLQVLSSDLHGAAATPFHIPPSATALPPATSSLAIRLTRASDTAGAAFDLLHGHLATKPAAELVRVAARDAVDLADHLTRLDRRLELALRAAARPDIDESHRLQLLATADACQRAAGQRLPEYVTVVSRVLSAPPRQLAQDLDLAPVAATTLDTAAKPAAAAHLVSQLRQAAVGNPAQLSLPDLTAIAAAGARISALAAFTSRHQNGPVGVAIKLARRWRDLHTELTPFNTPGNNRQLGTNARQICAWADPLIRHGTHTDFATTDWQTAIQDMTTDMARLAHTIHHAITEKIHNQQMLVPFDTHTRGRQHLYIPANPNDPRLAKLHHTTHALHREAQLLAQDIHRAAPAAHLQHTRVPARPAPPHRAAQRTSSTRRLPPPSNVKPPANPRR